MSPPLSRRLFTARLGAAVAAPALLGRAWAAPDERPVRVLVGFPPGGATDTVARLLAERLKDALKRPVVVEHRPGAGGQWAAQWLKGATPDGTTVLLSHDHTIAILPQVLAHPGFQPHTDFVTLGGFASFVNALAVSPGTPARTMAEFVTWVRRQGGSSPIGIPAPTSTAEFLVQRLAKRYGLDLAPVPYKGSAPMIGDMLSNLIPAGIASVPDFIEHQRSGRLRTLAVLGGARQPMLPDVPTLDELGIKGLDALPFFGFWAPQGTPADFINAFTHALHKTVSLPAVHQQLTDLGLAVDYMTPQVLDARERAYTQVWARILQDSGFKPK